MRMSSKVTAAHRKSITAILANLEAVPDTNLTFGTFLSVCQTLIESPGKTDSMHHEKQNLKRT